MNLLNNNSKKNRNIVNKKKGNFFTKLYVKPILLQSSNKVSIVKSTIHPFHLVDPSPWPFFAAMGTFFFTSGLVLFMHFFDDGYIIMRNGFILILCVAALW